MRTIGDFLHRVSHFRHCGCDARGLFTLTVELVLCTQ
ncbi:Uncharacterised protein [Vibrio cholerae]|nr:Uncharacterised protein [Vibrio cholerae]CSD41192.1 Uncharacterised protein [Vibrio cholerae]CSI50620.1 Uncharacterised protein [Vibrio cholerae]